VARVAAVLRAIAAEPGRTEVAGSEIARVVGRERSQVSRMLKSLAAAGLVEQNPETRAYRLGWQLFVLAARAGDQRLVGPGTAILRAVVTETGETALLSVLSGNRSFTVLSQRPDRNVQAGGWVGRTSPLHAAASGRALLLDLPDDAVRDLAAADIGAANLGPRAPTSLPQVLEKLARERQAGYCVALDELEGGLTSVGVPVRDSTGTIIAALNISGPTVRMADRIDALAATAETAARRLSRLITGGG
jgi:DNA-binding IclR family transcriptional regulator